MKSSTLAGRAAVAGVVALMAGGCSTAVAPRFTLEEVRRTQETPEGTVLEFSILAENRNGFPLPLRQAEYALLVDGERVFGGVRSAEATVRRYGVQRFTLPAVVPAGTLGDGEAHRAVLAGKVEYETPGALAQVLFDIGLRRTNAPLRVGGMVSGASEVIFEADPETLPEVKPALDAEPAPVEEPRPAPSVRPAPEPDEPAEAGPRRPRGRWQRPAE